MFLKITEGKRCIVTGRRCALKLAVSLGDRVKDVSGSNGGPEWAELAPEGASVGDIKLKCCLALTFAVCRSTVRLWVTERGDSSRNGKDRLYANRTQAFDIR